MTIQISFKNGVPIMQFSRESVRKMSKAELLRSVFDIREEEMPVGELRLKQLPDEYFEKVIEQHNAKLDFILQRVPEGLHEIGWELRTLKIPTFGEFQNRLDDSDHRKHVPPVFRKTGNYAVYQKWVLGQEPIRTIFYETFFKKKFPVYVPEKHRQRHVFCVGKSGSGKSETLKLLALASKMRGDTNEETGYPTAKRNCSFVLIDPHGDFALEMAQQRMYYGDYSEHLDDPDLIYLDPFLAADRGKNSKFPTINPFDVWDKGYSEFEIEKMAQQLTGVFQTLVSKGDATLSGTMETLLIPCITLLLNRPGSTLFDLLDLMKRDGNEHLVAEGRKSSNTGHKFFFTHSFREARFNVTKAALSTKIQSLLNNKAFTNFLARERSTIDLEHALNRGKSIIVNCSKGKAGELTMEAIGRFLVGMILGIAFNRAEKVDAPRTSIWLMIDEMQNFVSQEIETILAEARKYALHLTLACQIVGQNMSPQLSRLILGNSNVLMCGHAGADSQAAMAREMAVSGEDLKNLGVGEFVTKCGNAPALRVQMRGDFVGKSSRMTNRQWAEMKSAMIGKYYEATSEISATRKRKWRPKDEDPEASQLREDILNGRKVVVAESGEERKPKFGSGSPFRDLDLDV